LRDAKDEGSYHDRYLQLIRGKSLVGTMNFEVVRRPGPMGKVLAAAQKFLWKLLRYQHGRITFRQNLVNMQVARALELEREEVKKLADRVARLEKHPGP
jgi:hypothetical protein